MQSAGDGRNCEWRDLISFHAGDKNILTRSDWIVSHLTLDSPELFSSFPPGFNPLHKLVPSVLYSLFFSHHWILCSFLCPILRVMGERTQYITPVCLYFLCALSELLATCTTSCPLYNWRLITTFPSPLKLILYLTCFDSKY